MEKQELIELGRLLVDFPIAYTSIKSLYIIEEAGQHAQLRLKLVAQEGLTQKDVLPLENTPIKIIAPDGKNIFVGQCYGIGLEQESAYTEVTLQASSLSIETDIIKKSRTFQNTSKTLEEVANTVIGGYGITVAVKENIQIKEVLSQERETDWSFLRRIAAQYGFSIFTDSRSEQLRICIGPVGFSMKALKPPTTILSVEKGIDGFTKIQQNLNQEATVYDFMTEKIEAYDLALGTGHLVGEGTRPKVIVGNEILAQRGTVVNHITLAYEAGAVPEFSQAVEPVLTASILVGTVLDVRENEIKVHFQVDKEQDAGGAKWIPYEHELNNYMYCMPDIGDTVFVYYEKDGKQVALGSKHTQGDTHPDFEHPENKSLTSCNKMIKFTPKTIEFVANRKQYDGEGGNQSQIEFNKELGICIYSTQDIHIIGKQIIHLQASEEFIKIDEAPDVLDQQHDAGEAKYQADGGVNVWQQANRAAKEMVRDKVSEIYDSFADGIQGTIAAPFQLFSTVKDVFVGKNEGEGIEESAEAEVFEEGVVYLMGLQGTQLNVGESYIALDPMNIQIKTPLYRQLGFEKRTYEEVSEENKSWFDTILDVGQLALDIVGCIPGIGEVADLVNAGISLARGDYFGAAASLISCIPIVGDTVGKGMKALQKIEKVAKHMDKINIVMKVTRAFMTGAQTANTLINSASSLKDVLVLGVEGEFDITNREHVDMLVGVGQSATVATNFAVKHKQKKQKNKGDLEGTASTSKKKTEDPDTTKNPPKQNKTNKNTCKYDPINVATGSLTIEQVDFVMEDIASDFEIKRTYESIYTNTQQPLGSKWLLNIGSYLVHKNNEVIVLLPDFHIERFKNESGIWENQRVGDQSYVLVEMNQGYMLKVISEQKRYYYNKEGKLISILDNNNNQVSLIYKGDLLERLELANGQTLDFEYEQGKIVRLRDDIGRTISYHYEKDLLIGVTYPNGGTVRYTYSSSGHIESITDQNGHTYVRNNYDDRGRVVRQELANGEEYVILYDDDNRTNTFLVMSNNGRISYVYNKNNLVTKTIYQDDTYEEVAYDEYENEIYVRDRKGGEIHRKFNEKCLLLEEHLPNGLVLYNEYDEENRLIHTWDNAKRESFFTYDERGNLIQRKTKLAYGTWQVLQNTFDARGRLVTSTDPQGGMITYTYRLPFQKATTIQRPEGYTFEYKYDDVGRNMAIVSNYGEISFAYNNMNYKTMVIDAEGHTTKYFYDKLGNLEKEILPNAYNTETGEGIGTTYTYNVLDRLVRTIDPLGNVFALKRNTEGKITKEIHPSTYNLETDDGEGIHYRYDEEERRIKILYPDGGIERIQYDANGNIIKKIQPEVYDEALDDGPGYVYAYDSVNRLVQVQSPEGSVVQRYVYDLQGNIIKVIDAKGYLKGVDDTSRVGSLYTYNYVGWLLEKRIPVREEAGEIYYEVTQYTYDLVGNVVKEKRYLDEQNETSASGRVHTLSFMYDKENRLIQVSDCTGAVMEYRYDSLNHRTYERRKINETTYQITNYKYSSSGRLIEVSESADKLGTGRRFVATQYKYDPSGNLIQITTPKGYRIERIYDAANRLTQEKHYDKEGGIHNHITLDYDATGNVIQHTDVYGHQTRFSYDLLNREIRRISPKGGTYCTLYNKNGLIYKEIKPIAYKQNGEKGVGYHYKYDLLDRLIKVVDPLGQVVEEKAYNEAGELVQKRDGCQSGVNFTYDLGGRRQKVETTGGTTQTYQYDARGNIIGIRDGNEQLTKYQLDRWGRIVQIHKADESVERYSYDFAGNIVTTTDGNGQTITYQFNGLNKLRKIIDQEGLEEHFTYDAEGHLQEHTNRNGRKVRYDYNLYGSILSKQEMTTHIKERYKYYPDGKLQSAQAGGMLYHYTYDEEGNLKEKLASGRTLLAYTYDLNGNKRTQTDVTGKTISYGYNTLDALTEIIDNETKLVSYTYHPDGSLASISQLNGLYTQYYYDTDKNLSSLEVSLEGKQLVKNTYTYDPNGNRLEKAQRGGRTTYQYDNLNRLTKVGYPTYTEELFYDKVGNRTKRLVEGIEERYSYDVKNCLTMMTTTQGDHTKTNHYAYDLQGNLLRDNKATYTYDGFNRTEKVELFDGSIQINRYDAEGLRHEIEENGHLVQFIFNENKEVVVEQTASDTVRLIRGYDIAASQSEKTRTYYHYVSDELGSTTHIFEDQAIRNYYEYDAFGKSTVSQETVSNRFKYTGQQYDPMTQQYYLRARFYNPVIARFTQEDVYRGAGLNLYAYCDNNPISYFDPSGYDPCEVKKALYKKQGLSPSEANHAANNDLIQRPQASKGAGNPQYTIGSEVNPKHSTLEQRYEIMPGNTSSVGKWDGKTGESMFISNDLRVKKILEEHGVEGVIYKNGMPDFSPFVKEEFIIDMTNDRQRNFAQANKKLAEKLSAETGEKWTAKKVSGWISENKLTWHELNDCTTIQLVPSPINHPIFKHLGGVGEINISIGKGVR